jgi:hypothetical protein
MVPEYYPECVSLHCRTKNSTCLNLWSKLNGRCGNFSREPGDPLHKTLTQILDSGFKIHNIILSSPSPPHVESYKIFQVQFAFNMDKREFLAINCLLWMLCNQILMLQWLCKPTQQTSKMPMFWTIVITCHLLGDKFLEYSTDTR